MIEPFQNIALAFSGGGFRAAGFTLGTLSYFEHLGLLLERTDIVYHPRRIKVSIAIFIANPFIV
jgi:hypothetical protein